MDKKVYENTRYQNIYRNIKNKNYIVMLSKPIKTSISSIDGRKIYDIKEAISIRDNISLEKEKAQRLLKSGYIKDLWVRYINYCIEVEKLAYNTLKKKKILYNKYIIELEDVMVSKLLKEDIMDFINGLNASDKQKNTVFEIFKAFLNWCVKENIISYNPMSGLKKIRTLKTEMKYWNVEEFKKFMEYINNLNNPISNMIKTLVIIEFNLGDRIGETRALTWSCINKEHNTIEIKHSINYDSKDNDYLSNTKNYQSERVIDVSPRLIEELDKYHDYLIDIYGNVNDLILYNYKMNKPYSDTNLRKHFYKYCEEAGVPKIRLYDLRHTYVTLMMSEGWELYHISKRIGHKNYSTTVDKYGHIEGNIRKEIAKTTDKYY